MKIIVSQQKKRIKITLQQGNIVDNYVIDKADEFLLCIDKFCKRYKIDIRVFKKASLEFINVSMLTGRVIRAIIAGLRF